MDETQNPSPFPFEAPSPVFIVRLWWETATEDGAGQGEWRGSVEFLPAGERRFFRDLAAMTQMIAGRLQEIQPQLNTHQPGEK